MESAWTQELLNWLQAHPGWGFITVLLVALFESLVLIGILLPGMFILFGVGALIGLGVLDLTPGWIAATSGAFLGAFISYALGRRSPVIRCCSSVVRIFSTSTAPRA